MGYLVLLLGLISSFEMLTRATLVSVGVDLNLLSDLSTMPLRVCDQATR